ncbi:MAG TPA: hypothetical protein PKA06_06820 [Gemmatales bacterium]|nr:hypothetical protein [Gemmatales bacterium]HMP16701.1 hypothetical protein [Gemmatales bacterium]
MRFVEGVYTMSSASAKALRAPLRPLTSAASNLLGFWWLAIITGVLLIIAMWPSIFTEGNLGGYLLFIVVGVLLALGIWCTLGFVKAQSWSAGAMRLVAMIGIGVGLAGIGFFLYSVAFASTPAGAPTFWGPSAFLSGVLWAVMFFLPLIFALAVIFGLMSDGIDDWFNPLPIEPATRAGIQVDPRTAALMAGGAGLSAQLSDEALMGDLNEALDMTDKNASLGDDQSIEVIGSADDDLSVEVIGDEGKAAESDSMAELAALEEVLTEDASKKIPQPSQEKKPDIGKGDEPLAVDDDFKL